MFGAPNTVYNTQHRVFTGATWFYILFLCIGFCFVELQQRAIVLSFISTKTFMHERKSIIDSSVIIIGPWSRFSMVKNTAFKTMESHKWVMATFWQKHRLYRNVWFICVFLQLLPGWVWRLSWLAHLLLGLLEYML